MRTTKRPAATAFLSALAMLAAGTLWASHALADDAVVPEPGAAGEIAGGTEHGVCSAVPFSQARIVVGEGGARLLVVTLPADTRGVHLEPYVYVMQPDYWAIGVVHCDGDDGAVAGTVPEVTFGLAGYLGRRGIEVVGVGQTVKLDIAP
ncbi:MAG: hypothetical protein R3D33_10635 [Hyphomicrobiaceae bacterium]